TTVQQIVPPAAAVTLEEVASPAPGEPVRSAAAEEGVVPGASREPVIAPASDEVDARTSAPQPVRAGTPLDDDVVVGRPVDGGAVRAAAEGHLQRVEIIERTHDQIRGPLLAVPPCVE